jgi:hypothetical protein
LTIAQNSAIIVKINLKSIISMKETLSFVVIDGIKFFGTPDSNITESEVENLAAPTDFMLHILRHFSEISDEARAEYLSITESNGRAITVTNELIDEKMKTLGSKFHTGIDHPQALVGRIKKKLMEEVTKQEIPWIRNANGYYQRVIKLTFNDYDKHCFGLDDFDMAGTAGVIAITDETKDEFEDTARGTTELADKYIVKKAKRNALPMTDDIIVTISKDQNGKNPRFFGLYTGSVAPPIPHKAKQSPEEFEQAIEFWDTHAFVEVVK